MPGFVWLYIIGAAALVLMVLPVKAKGLCFTVGVFGIVLGIALQINARR